MIHADIGLVAAMPEETAPLLRLVGTSEQERVGRHRIDQFAVGKHTVCLVESGMGPTNAAAATRLLIDTAKPKVILNFGFAGALSPQLKVGDIVMANRLLFLHQRLFSEQQGLDIESTNLCSELLGKNGSPVARQAAFITASQITSKKEIAGRLPTGIERAVVEMESSAVAQVARKEGIPLIAIRAISDELRDELGFSLDEFCDKEMNLQKWRIMLTVARRPWIIPQLMRLSGNTRKAGKVLAEAVLSILSYNLSNNL